MIIKIDILCELSKKYYYLIYNQEKKYDLYKTEENEANLYIYNKMFEMLEKISIDIIYEERILIFISYGIKIKEMALFSKINTDYIITDLKKINNIIKEIRLEI